MTLQRDIISSFSCVRHVCLWQKTFLGLFLCTSLKAPEHPSHHPQGPSEAVSVQNSLPDGAMLNGKDTYCRSAALAKWTLNHNHYTLSVLYHYRPLEHAWLHKAPSPTFFLDESEVYEARWGPPCLLFCLLLVTLAWEYWKQQLLLK